MRAGGDGELAEVSERFGLRTRLRPANPKISGLSSVGRFALTPQP